MFAYAADYPEIIATQILIKTAITTIICLIQGCVVLRKKMFNGCKLLYGFKLLQICIVFYHIFMDDDILEE
jgi:hypothetical protein